MLLLWIATALAGPPTFDEPLRTGVVAPDDAAVVIGIEDYAFIEDVPHAVHDAQVFRDVLLYTRGIPSNRIKLLKGASREMILKAVEDAAETVGDDGRLWVYFSGHGAPDPSTGERLILGDDVRASTTTLATRGVSVGELTKRTMDAPQTLMVLDAGFSGTLRSGDPLFDGARFAVPDFALTTGPQVTVWSAAGPGQSASALDAARHGVFTYLTVGALRGWADGEIDGQRDRTVTADEVRAYVSRMTRAATDGAQTPSLRAMTAVLTQQVREKAPSLEEILQRPDLGGEDAIASLIAASTSFEEAKAKILDKAEGDWKRVFPLAHAGTAEGLAAVNDFLDTYQGGIEVIMNEETRTVHVPEKTLAFEARNKLLEGLAAPSHTRTPKTWEAHKAKLERQFEREQKREERHESRLRRAASRGQKVEREGVFWTQLAPVLSGAYNPTAKGAGGGANLELIVVPEHSGKTSYLGYGARAGLYATKNSGVQIGERVLPTLTWFNGSKYTREALTLSLGAGATGFSAGTPRPVSELGLGYQTLDQVSGAGAVLGFRLEWQQAWALDGPVQQIIGISVYLGMFMGS